ncbi:uncharacterized protein LOC133785171 [Humulus lupulus]|uniref:uncharacterized protein LOC133785171 n=1 Tax=Humulus lupulus TaxID=3486 RepID=UPI002B406733|nr:uncharacterized protein LOC133785171 [Humulus lupulus]
MSNSFPNWDYYSSSVISYIILLIWQSKFVKVQILGEDTQFVHCKIRVSGHVTEFFLTAVYGSNSILDRKILWDKLAGLGYLNLPWIVLGDFNAMFSYQDRNGGRPITAKEVYDAQNWLSLGQLDEFRCAGSSYTWSNKHEIGDRIYSKLDRVFTNEKWLYLFPNIEGICKWDSISDHSYCVIKNQVIGNIGIKLFRFFDCWMFHSMFKDVVLNSWNKVTSKAGLASIILKLYRVKHMLKKFSKKEVGDIPYSYQVAKESFNLAQGALANDPLNTMHQLNEQIKLQEFIQARKRNFMGKKISAIKRIDTNSLSFGEKLSVPQQVKLIRPFTKDDVKEALFGIHSIKSPGPDGFGAGFFKGLWNEIGNDISMAVLKKFHDGVLPSGLNESVISLIPRLNPLKKQQIIDLLLAAIRSINASLKCCVLDLLKGYTRKDISARCIMKIDLSKAYDTVDWQFVADLLKGLCFPSRFIHWVLVCLKGTSYSLMINGRLHGTFRGEKGLRQGDLISPLLFVLIMEYLTRLLLQTSRQKGFGFHPLCLSINNTKSHIYFGGMKDDCKSQLLEITQMEEGSFPLKYLGIHLRPTKWRAADCGEIIEKIQRNLHS